MIAAILILIAIGSAYGLGYSDGALREMERNLCRRADACSVGDRQRLARHRNGH